MEIKKQYSFFLFAIFIQFLPASYLPAQSLKIDSLEKVLRRQQPDSVRIKLLLELFTEIRFSNPVKAMEMAKEAKSTAQKGNNKRLLASASSRLGLIYSDLGHLDQALANQLEALNIYEKMQDTLQVAGMQLNVAMIYKKRQSIDEALRWLSVSLQNFKIARSKIGEAYVYNNLAIISRDKKEFNKALDYYTMSIAIKKELKDTSSLGNGYMNIGLIYEDIGDKQKAMDYYNSALEMYRASNNIKGFAGVYNNIGTLLMDQGNLGKGKDYLLKSLTYSQEVHSKEDEQEAHLNLSRCYELLGDYDNATKHHILYRECKDSILNSNASKQIALMQAVYETDKKDQELEKLTRDAQITEEQLARDNMLIGGSAAGVILLIAILSLLYNRYRFRERSNRILAETNQLINMRRKEITDSITYARRIQQSILPRFEKFTDIIPQSFLLHKPRQIVSGDFYWLYRENNVIYLAVADNVLHGVPGAFISMVGVNILNNAVEEKQIGNLQQLITYMDKNMLEMFSENAIASNARRLNLSVCRLDVSGGTLEYAGTDNPLYLVNSKGVEEVSAFGADSNLKTQQLRLKKGDTIYMFTDGYVDQMGGGEGKKMLTRKVSEILFRNWPVPMEKQKEGLLQEFESWRGNYEQVDDVLVMGVRFQ